MSTLTLTLDPDQVDTMQRLRSRTGADDRSILLDALDAYERELDGFNDDSLTPEQAAECYAGIAAIERGEGIPHEQVVAETKAKYGW